MHALSLYTEFQNVSGPGGWRHWQLPEHRHRRRRTRSCKERDRRIEGERIVARAGQATVGIPKGARSSTAAGHTVLPASSIATSMALSRRDMRQHLLNAPTYNVLRSTAC